MAGAPLTDLDAFAAVARARSFRRAAIERGVSASTLSATVKALEARLGVRLLNRTTRSVTPTDAGARLYERLAPLLADLGQALDAVNEFRDTPAGTLRLNVPSAVSKLVLAPLVARFLAAYPDVVMEIVDDNTFLDVFASGFDAGVRYGEHLEADMIAVPIGGPQRYAVAAAPARLAVDGTPSHPRDLVGRACIRHRFPSGAILPWEFERAGEEIRLLPDGPLVVTSAEVAVRAAEDGAGFVYSFEGFLREAIASGRLVEVLADWSVAFPGPFLYYPSRRHVPGPLRAFVAFLRAQAEFFAEPVRSPETPVD